MFFLTDTRSNSDSIVYRKLFDRYSILNLQFSYYTNLQILLFFKKCTSNFWKTTRSKLFDISRSELSRSELFDIFFQKPEPRLALSLSFVDNKVCANFGLGSPKLKTDTEDKTHDRCKYEATTGREKV